MSYTKYKPEELAAVPTGYLTELRETFKREVEEQQAKLSLAQSNLARIKKELKNRRRNGG